MSNTVTGSSALRSAGESAQSLYDVEGRRKYLNRAELRRSLDAIKVLEPARALFALTLVWTGARVSEVLALTPASFQIEQGVVAFVTLKRRRLAVREVPIPETLMEALDKRFDLRAIQCDSTACDRRIWPWHRVTAWRVIKTVMRAAHVVGRPACPRGLRHGFGVGVLQSGVPLNLLQRWLGHARLSTTAIYAEASGAEERAMARRFWGDCS